MKVLSNQRSYSQAISCAQNSKRPLFVRNIHQKSRETKKASNPISSAPNRSRFQSSREFQALRSVSSSFHGRAVCTYSTMAKKWHRASSQTSLVVSKSKTNSLDHNNFHKQQNIPPTLFPGSRLNSHLAQISPRLRRISEFLERNGHPKFRLKQIMHSIYKKHLKRFSEMTDLPAPLKTGLIDLFQADEFLSLQSLTLRPKKSSQAQKYLFQLHDQEKVETVHMEFKNPKQSLCISSQVGCALRCKFCATGAIGIKRQMTADEISDQVLFFLQNQQHIDSVAFMGMGEPLANPKVFDALTILTDKDGMNIAPRRLSVSTVGVTPAIDRLAKDFPALNLAFSLHSPFLEQRSELVPANLTYPLPDVLEALDRHTLATNRKLFIAYLLLEETNTSEEHAKGVAELLRTKGKPHRDLWHVNLLRYNPAHGIGVEFPMTSEKTVETFSYLLRKHGLKNITVRQAFGREEDAACGQLYAAYKRKEPKPERKRIISQNG